MLRIGTLTLVDLATWMSPFTSERQVLVPYESLIGLHAAYTPDADRAAFRTTPDLIPGEGSAPGFDIA